LERVKNLNKQTIEEVIEILHSAYEERDWEIIIEALNLLENPPSEFDEFFVDGDS